MAESATERARALAEAEHEGQRRKANHQPYLDHVSVVAEMLSERRYDDEVVAAALLHDTVEHTSVEADQVRGEFGDRIADLVAAMTDREEIEPFDARKDEHRGRIEAAGRDACAIYAADKVAGIREARDGFEEVGPEVEERLGNTLATRFAVWEADLEMLETVSPPLELAVILREELSSLRSRLAEARHPHATGGGPAAAPTA